MEVLSINESSQNITITNNRNWKRHSQRDKTSMQQLQSEANCCFHTLLFGLVSQV